MTDKEVMQMALDALNTLAKELISCRDELAERGARPETPHKQKLWDSAFYAYTGMAIPTYEAIRARLSQPEKEWVGLTDEEIPILFKNSLKSIPAGIIWNISRTIEAKLKEKNT
jgi:hypothetical protein